MADEEKTEQPTDKKLSDARRRGQMPRSRESGTFFVLMSGVLGLWFMGPYIGNGLRHVIISSMSLTRDQVFTLDEMGRVFRQDIIEIALPLLGFILIIMACALIGNLLIGGYNFSWEAMMPKFSKLSPLSGIKRVFSVRSLMELIKSIAKIAFIGAFCYFALSGRAPDILRLAFINPGQAIHEAINLIFQFMVIIVCALIPIVLMDVPFQKWNYIQQLRMTKQEVKDEYKDAEGNPQIKSKIKQKQFQMAAARMMQKVPKADVVVTNPTHYAVALQYDPDGTTAPILVAKGVDEVAQKIIFVAREVGVPVIPLPPLARSLYYTTELDHQIPRGLFKAVAQVLAWVLGMKAYREGKSKTKPRDLDRNLPIPPELRF